MKRMLIFSGALGVALAFYYHSMLPAMAALNFGFDGRADSLAGKGSFLLVALGMHCLFTALFYFFPALMTKIPRDYLNLPHIEYWFAPERLADSTKKIAEKMYVFGTVTNVFLIFCSTLSYRANITDNKTLDLGTFIAGLLIYLAVTAYWAYRFHRDFQRP